MLLPPVYTNRRKGVYIPYASSHMISASLKKTRGTNLRFFLTFFDKIKSQKRCTATSNPVL